MPTENKPAAPGFNLNTPDGGRGYIAHLFKTVLRRHDYRQYIAERLAGDFACTLAQHFEDVKAQEQALQLRLNAQDERVDLLEKVLAGLLFEFDDGVHGGQETPVPALDIARTLIDVAEFQPAEGASDDA